VITVETITITKIYVFLSASVYNNVKSLETDTKY